MMAIPAARAIPFQVLAVACPQPTGGCGLSSAIPIAGNYFAVARLQPGDDYCPASGRNRYANDGRRPVNNCHSAGAERRRGEERERPLIVATRLLFKIVIRCFRRVSRRGPCARLQRQLIHHNCISTLHTYAGSSSRDPTETTNAFTGHVLFLNIQKHSTQALMPGLIAIVNSPTHSLISNLRRQLRYRQLF